RPPPLSTLFPYTTLFRSAEEVRPAQARGRAQGCRRLAGEELRDLDVQVPGPRVEALRGAGAAVRGTTSRRGRGARGPAALAAARSEEHTSELQSPYDLVC